MASILFSPVGSHDPMSNNRDGSMLHICRRYHPETVVLYLSKEMIQYHREDDRYRTAIRLLAGQEGFPVDIRVVERPELEDVHIFDYFFQEFRQILIELHSEFPEHKILLNVSSGTPGMKTALYLLAEFLPFPVRPVQIGTPRKQHNNIIQEKYDTRQAWTENEDNRSPVNRCQEMGYNNLNLQLQKESILAHLQSWDYAAAFRQAESIRGLLNPRACELLKAAKARIEMNWRSIPAQLREELGLAGSNTKAIDRTEYLLWLQMKQQRGDLADFLRGLTPALFALLQAAAEEKEGILLSAYCNDSLRFVRNKLLAGEKGKELLKILERGNQSIDRAFLTSAHYTAVLEAKCANEQWWNPLLELREVEKDARNLAAHTITRVDEAWLQKNGIQSSREIMQLVKNAVVSLNNEGKPMPARIEVSWDAYDTMNKIIKKALENS